MSHPFLLAACALAVMSAVRVTLAVATGDRPARWLAAPALWAALVVGALAAPGCVDAEDGQQNDAGTLPDAPGGGIDAAAPPDAAIDAAPDGPDAPPAPLVEVEVTIGPDGPLYRATVAFSVNCPDGAPDGPHRGGVELYVGGALHDVTAFDWTCDFSWSSSTWFDLPCGVDVWARGVIVHPVTGEPAYQLTTTTHTPECQP